MFGAWYVSGNGRGTGAFKRSVEPKVGDAMLGFGEANLDCIGPIPGNSRIVVVGGLKDFVGVRRSTCRSLRCGYPAQICQISA